MPCTDHWAVNSQVYAETCGILSKFFSYFCFMPHSAHTNPHTRAHNTYENFVKIKFHKSFEDEQKKKFIRLRIIVLKKVPGPKDVSLCLFPWPKGAVQLTLRLIHIIPYTPCCPTCCVCVGVASVCVCVCVGLCKHDSCTAANLKSLETLQSIS